MSRHSILLPLMMMSAVALCACSGGNSPAPSSLPAKAAPMQSANEAQAAKEAALYEQMRASGSWDIALTLGNEVVTKFAGTPAAAQVQQSIAEVRAKGEALANQHRLSRLWTYTATPEAGGTQYAAAIVAQNSLDGNAKVRLVLRQHPKWGQSVYLLLDSAKFDCRKGCATLPVSFDGAAAQHMKATIPPTGEPALFIDDDKGFIAKLEKSQTVAIGATVRDLGDKTMEFEIGGYDLSNLPQKPKKSVIHSLSLVDQPANTIISRKDAQVTYLRRERTTRFPE